MSSGSPLNIAKQMAYTALEGNIMKQSVVLSYMDVFMGIGIVFLVGIPIILFAKSSKAKVDMSNMH
ncbi:hypothetical protein D3C77_820680 [compost metagenome]